MKPEVIIQQGLKSANILLKNAQKRAAELDHLKGELVIVISIYNRLLLNILYVINQKYGLNL